MFDDNQSSGQTQDNSGAMQASMPDPIDGPFQGPASAVNSAFGSAPSPTTNAPSSPPLSPSFDSPSPVTDQNTTAPVYMPPAPDAPTAGSNSTPPESTSSTSSDELLDLKQQALQHLSPLVSHLDQTPEEQFRTTMMMIQASDDQTLIKSAFEAAQKITDDKSRAQALLDVINEINYFTQHGAQPNISS